MDDLIYRQAAIDVLSFSKGMLSRVLDEIDLDGTDREKYSWALGLIEANIKDIEELPSVQPDVPDTNVGNMISRQDAIDALGERPIVWTDNDDYTLGERNQYDMDRLAIETVPSVDAVEVVRCKYCKHSTEWYRDKRRCFLWCENGMYVFEDGYCSYGERKNDD